MLEDDLLSCLSAAHGNFLGDISLVEQLENTKTTASHIEYKVRSLDRQGPLSCPTVFECMCYFSAIFLFLNVTQQQVPHFIALAANDV